MNIALRRDFKVFQSPFCGMMQGLVFLECRILLHKLSNDGLFMGKQGKYTNVVIHVIHVI